MIGRNNSGKSSTLLPILALQKGLVQLIPSDMRLGISESQITVAFDKSEERYFNKADTVTFQGGGNPRRYVLRTPARQGVAIEIGQIEDREPNNLIYPFLSKRKVGALGEQINDQIVEQILANFHNLNAKIDRLSNVGFVPGNAEYVRGCEEILGFLVTSANSQQGKKAVYTVENLANVPLLSMGEGVMNVLGLLVDLSMTKAGKIFVIEEPENDLHPQALKALLDLVARKSKENQFFISTHSNIVLKRLGALAETKIFRFTLSFNERMPTTTVAEVEHTAHARREILEELGYELSDQELWEGWLFLEESSAEKIIREYLIPLFVPSLQSRLRTFSAHSLAEVPTKLRDFNELFVYLHLEPTYKNRVWVVVDGGEAERQIIDDLKRTYEPHGWKPEHFSQFSKHDFEEYYPAEFGAQVATIKGIKDKQARREAKRLLLEKVESSLREDKGAARTALEKSASEVIGVLRNIAAALDKRTSAK